jgi:DNA-binding PadR family transcriptional regulator
MEEGTARRINRWSANWEPLAPHSAEVARGVLGLLIERPSYGYELVQRFERVYGDTLAMSAAKRIYEALEQLSDRGLIEVRPPAAAAGAPPRRPRINYGATTEGRRAYEAWLVAEVAEQRRQSLLFAQQLSMLTPEKALEVIDRYEQECVTAAEEAGESEGPEVSDRLESEEERLSLQTRLLWIDYARRELEALSAERAGAEREGRQ